MRCSIVGKGRIGGMLKDILPGPFKLAAMFTDLDNDGKRLRESLTFRVNQLVQIYIK